MNVRRNLAYHMFSCLLVISIPPGSAVLHVHRTSIFSSFLPPSKADSKKRLRCVLFPFPSLPPIYNFPLSSGKSRGGCGKGYTPKIRWKADQKSIPGKVCIKRPPLAFIKIRILKGKEANNIPNGGFISFPRASELGLFLYRDFFSAQYHIPLSRKKMQLWGKRGGTIK